MLWRKMRFRFGTKSMLLFLLVICIPLAWIQHHRNAFKQEQDALRRLIASSPLSTKRVEVYTGTFLGFNGWVSTLNLM